MWPNKDIYSCRQLSYNTHSNVQIHTLNSSIGDNLGKHSNHFIYKTLILVSLKLVHLLSLPGGSQNKYTPLLRQLSVFDVKCSSRFASPPSTSEFWFHHNLFSTYHSYRLQKLVKPASTSCPPSLPTVPNHPQNSSRLNRHLCSFSPYDHALA